MNEEIKVLYTVTQKLERNAISYMVTGSVAMNYYAKPRLTRDIDIVVEITENDIERFVKMFSDEFYINKNSISIAIHSRSMFNIIHSKYVIKIDFIVRKQTPYRRLEFQRRKRIKLAGSEFWMVSAEDLILSKLWWARTSRSERQLGDVKNIIMQNANIDKKYLKEWAHNLEIYDLYEEICNE